MTKGDNEFGATAFTGTRVNTLRARLFGVDTHQEAVVFMRHDCSVCRSEGFSAHARVQLTHGKRSIIATLFLTSSDLFRPGDVGLSDAAWERLGLADGDEVG